MDDETRDGGAFFASGRVESRRFLSQPQRRGDDFYIRQDVSARAASMAELPVELRRLVELHHPDLARDPQAVLAGAAA